MENKVEAPKGVFLLGTDGQMYKMGEDKKALVVDQEAEDVHGMGFGEGVAGSNVPAPEGEPNQDDVSGHHYDPCYGYHLNWMRGRVYSYEFGCWGYWWHYHPWGCARVIIRY